MRIYIYAYLPHFNNYFKTKNIKTFSFLKGKEPTQQQMRRLLQQQQQQLLLLLLSF